MDMPSIYTQELQSFVQDHLSEDPAHLLLKYSGKTHLDIKAAVTQIAARQKSAHKLPEWSTDPTLIFPPMLSIEQCSSQVTALYKAQLFHGQSFIDLTGGFGVDTFYIGRNFSSITYVERQKELFGLASHNLISLLPSKAIQFVNGDGIHYLQETDQIVDLVYADPARRGEGNQKLYELNLTEPDVVSHWELLSGKANTVMIKASPMLDIYSAITQLKDLSSIHIVAHKQEVKELLLIKETSIKRNDPEIHVVELAIGYKPIFSFTRNEEKKNRLNIGPLGRFLVIPHPGIVKAGGYNTFSRKFDLVKTHANTQIYTSDVFPHSKIPGKGLEVIKEIKLDRKQIRREFPTGIANVISKNHPLKAEDCKTKFKLRDGGEDFLVLLRDFENRGRALICKAIKQH
jgi:hypothetical protein